ncbi:hypothetical protein SeMB42_g05531 [Synchytrium endobioticum]|uniref:Uncharacterized protein n=1 Tax=Synchytrium endobioticum TaxID=286115 RepID=A0A507CR07_9FUNG|nr:hypothetical protein SeLEV6574_g06606 [Synchytrium endobioticum]TPX41541.1 hypothetical protein SeMB42_g05531 [Synchytrium endobioticum]
MPIQILNSLPQSLVIVPPNEATPSHFDTSDASTPLIRHHQPNTILDISPPILITATNARIGGSLKGDLYIGQNKIYFSSSLQTLSIDYLNIIVHAISRSGDRVLIKPHIYCQFDENICHNIQDGDGNALSTSIGSCSSQQEEKSAEDEQDQDDDQVTYEMRIVPDDSDSLDALFQTMSECASLHPDPTLAEEEDTMPDFMDPDAGWVFASDDQHGLGSQNGVHRFAPYYIPNHHPTTDTNEEAEMMNAAMQHIQNRFDVPSGYVEDVIASTTSGNGRENDCSDGDGPYEDIADDMQR